MATTNAIEFAGQAALTPAKLAVINNQYKYCVTGIDHALDYLDKAMYTAEADMLEDVLRLLHDMPLRSGVTTAEVLAKVAPKAASAAAKTVEPAVTKVVEKSARSGNGKLILVVAVGVGYLMYRRQKGKKILAWQNATDTPHTGQEMNKMKDPEGPSSGDNLSAS
jgi:hypothetical protein